ncbi:MAG: hypothetical protein IJK56_04460 [Firmicutes bacterium]|nr:hypothetical protein [Bacillota bacterium]
MNMETKNKCCTYFRIVGDFDPDDISARLGIVPEIYVDDINPCLAPSLDVIDFCHATRTEIDIDLYICKDE